MRKVKMIFKIVNGKFKGDLNLLKECLKAMEGKTIELTLEVRRNKRSNQQNSYYWSVIVPIFKNILKEEWGELRTIKETHEFLKYNCNYKEKVNEDTGEILKLARSTKDNDTKVQEEFHERCRQLAFEMFNITIPLPNEQITID